MKNDNKNLKDDVKYTKSLPFSTEHFLDIVGDASKRSRQFLLLLVFAGILILMAVVNSFIPKYNWFTSRVQISQNIIKYICFDNKEEGRVGKLSEFIIENEKINGVIIDSLFFKNHRKYLSECDTKYSTNKIVFLHSPKKTPIIYKDSTDRKEKYIEIGNAINFSINNNIYSIEQIKDHLNKLDESKIEHFDIVRVPILGVSFDVNYLGMYSGLILVTLYFLLYFSLSREYTSLKIAFKRGWSDLKHHHYYFYEYVSMSQVLSIPPKLFLPYRRVNLFYKLFPFIAILFPSSVYLIVYSYDLKSFNIGYDTNSTMTIISTTISSFMLLLMIIVIYFVLRLWVKMDKFWDYQTYEFNFEFILECMGEDEIDLLHFSDERLSNIDNDSIKQLWHKTITDFFAQNPKISRKKCMKMFGKFITVILKNKISIKPNHYEKDLDLVNINWITLVKWFKEKGKKNIGSTFRDNFFKLMNDLKENNPIS